MKIVGYTYYRGELHFTMKCDASLLNQRKPFFIPDWANDFRYIPCTAVRISRLGKCIAEQYAHRYYDAIATGLDFMAYDLLPNHYAKATAFDSSLCVGEWQSCENLSDDLRQQIDLAIHNCSQIVTLRIGDIVYTDQFTEAMTVLPSQIIEQNLLYCKIK